MSLVMEANHRLAFEMLSQDSRDVVICYLKQEVLRCEETLHSLQVESQILADAADSFRVDIVRTMYRRDIFQAAVDRLLSAPEPQPVKKLVSVGDA